VADLTVDMVEKLLNYGIAGIVIILLFRIIFNDLSTMKQLLQQTVYEVQQLRVEVRELKAMMEEFLRTLKSK
jgi:hypothetical protein